MARWQPGARERLRTAALELYLERGFESVTAAEIAERAGLARRTFFRYFPDKREVLFAGSAELADEVRTTVAGADARRTPLDVALDACHRLGTQLAEQSSEVSKVRKAIDASPELQERERSKVALLNAALVEGLQGRGVEATRARLIAEVAGAVLRTALARWVEEDQEGDFAERFAAVTAELRQAIDEHRPHDRSAATRGEQAAPRSAG